MTSSSSTPTPRAAERLADALRTAGLASLADAALAGRYDEFASESPTPLHDLERHLLAARTPENTPAVLELVKAMRSGAFDASREEAQLWAANVEDPELRRVIDAIGGMPSRARPRWRR